ncbi:MAG: hypothetical protein ACOYL5_10400 [Phototrophicaceae bacterium]
MTPKTQARQVRFPRWLVGILVILVAGIVALALFLLLPHTPAPLQTVASSEATPAPAPIGEFVAQRAGYYDTVWPSEHADLWRSHAALGAGLPANFDAAALSVTTARLNLPSWGYTRNADEVFVIGGSPFVLNTFTQAIKTGEEGGGLQNTVADMLSDDIPYVAKVNPLTMDTQLTMLERGSTANYTGGLLMHQNGYVYAVAQAVLYKINPNTMTIEASVGLPLVGGNWATQYWTTYNGLQVLASGQLVIKGFSLVDSVNVPGYLLLVNPQTLAFDVVQSMAVSSARLTLEQAPDGSAYLYHVNALESLRFVVSETGFVLDANWTRSYRTEGDGSTQASSPMLYGELGQIVFANNTAPGATVPIQLYTQPTSANGNNELLSPQAAFSSAQAAYNFFMVGGDPFERQLVIYYDPMNDLLSAQQVTASGELVPVWERDSYKVSASPAIVPDRDLLYVDDYRDGHDWLIVLQLSTGEELAAIQLEAQLPTIGTIFPGMNDDVYLLSSEAATENGLISRVFVP